MHVLLPKYVPGRTPPGKQWPTAWASVSRPVSLSVTQQALPESFVVVVVVVPSAGLSPLFVAIV